jgi:acetylornithine deacetylase
MLPAVSGIPYTNLMSTQLPSYSLSPSSATVDILRTLVGFNTVSHESNLGLIEWTRDYLAGLGVMSRLSYDASSRKANLFCTLGEGRLPGVVLSGHTDVVPVTGQAWDTDPFKLTLKDNYLYGRGSADMKGFIATCLAWAPKFLASDMKGAVHLALSYDEEIGCFGVRELLADLKDAGIRPAACVVGEPTGMMPIVAHKGVERFRCCVTGREAHSALANQGVNAIEVAALLVVYIRSLAQELARSETRNYGFAVPYTTMQTTLLNGGTSDNIIPRQCDFLVDVRTLPGQSFPDLFAKIQTYAKTLLPEMQAIAPEAGIALDYLCGVPPFAVDDQAAITQLVKRLARQDKTGYVMFGTEAGLFRDAGIPTVVCGPGAIDVAHRPNECISLEQLAQAELFMDRLILSDTLLANA